MTEETNLTTLDNMEQEIASISGPPIGTRKEALLVSLDGWRGGTASQKYEAVALGTKIVEANGSIVLNPAELKLLKAASIILDQAPVHVNIQDWLEGK